jgi:type II secretory pathway pseudopilin PulG
MRSRRQGFTITELLVALALIIFIMAILSEAFSAATKSFTDLKALGDMAEKLRSVTTQLRRDLASDHFDGKRRLSDPGFMDDGPPREGFFRIWQSTPSQSEGMDADGIASFRSTGMALHFASKLRGNQRSDIYTASLLDASNPLQTLGQWESRYQDPAHPAFNFQWADIAYFLRASKDANGKPDLANGVTPLYTLYRRQLVAVPDDIKPTVAYTNPKDLKSYFPEISIQPDRVLPNVFFNSARDLTMPARRFGMNGAAPGPNPPTPVYAGIPLLSNADLYPTLGDWNTSLNEGDLLLTDVVSFDIRVLLDGRAEFVDLYDNQGTSLQEPSIDPKLRVSGYSNKNLQYNFSIPTPTLVFDTWSGLTDDVYDYSNRDNYSNNQDQTPRWAIPGTNASIPLYKNADGKVIRIKAIQITIRIWDSKTLATRQVTVVQDM